MVSEVKIVRCEGDTYPEIAKISQNGVPVDLAGKTVFMEINRDGDIQTISADVLAAADGRVSFPMSIVSGFETGRYRYRVRVNDGSYTTTFAKGTLEIE